MDFTIVTPSHRQLDWLACCIASVADQEGVTVEHIVQDAGTEGFAEFAERMRKRWPDREGYRRVMISETDAGMYDAINKGLKRGSGRICAYLNCDEQYLPGALVKVKEGFAKHSEAEILYGGFLVVNEQGRLVTAQRPVRMFWPHVATSHLANFTCATFFRRAMLERDQAWFDPSYRACGDAVWTVARLKARTPSWLLRQFVAVFAERAHSQGLSKIGSQESFQLKVLQPQWIRALGWLWKVIHRGRKFFSGQYFPAYVSSQIFLYPLQRESRQAVGGILLPFWTMRLRRVLERD